MPARGPAGPGRGRFPFAPRRGSGRGVRRRPALGWLAQRLGARRGRPVFVRTRTGPLSAAEEFGSERIDTSQHIGGYRRAAAVAVVLPARARAEQLIGPLAVVDRFRARHSMDPAEEFNNSQTQLPLG